MRGINRLGSLIGALVLALAAGAQTPPQQDSVKPAKAKAKRVFTEDDLQGLRKPWDEYADQKHAAEQASQTAAAAAAKADESQPAGAPAKPGAPLDDPNSPKAIARELAKWEDELKRNERLTAEARQELTEATQAGRAELAKQKLEIYEQNIVDLKQKVTDTRTQLAEAQKKSKAAAPAAPAPPEAGTGNPPTEPPLL